MGSVATAAVAAATTTAAAVAAATTTAAAVAAAAAATAAAAVLLGAGLVDGQVAAADLRAGQRGDGGLGLLVAAHLDEAEALRAAGVTVHDHLGRLHRAVGGEHLLQVGTR